MDKIGPTLSIIVVSYNTKELLQNCLESILKNDKRLDFSGKWIDANDEEKIPTEIIVVDNGSRNGSKEYLKTTTKNLKVIFNDCNLGFAKANNQGIKIARGEYVLLLNSDTIITEGAISQTLYWLAARPEVGIATCKLLNEDGSLQATGGFFPNLLNIFTWAFFIDDLPLVNKLVRPFHPHPPQFWTKENWYKTTRSVDWITGAFFMIRKAVIRDIGKIDEKFFMYAEELEWCYRAKKTGWKVYYFNSAKITHLGGGSGQSTTPIVGEDKGLKRFFFLHRPKWQLPILSIILKLKNLARIVLFFLLGRWEKSLAYAKVFSGKN